MEKEKKEYEVKIGTDGQVSEFLLKNINIRSVDATSYNTFSQAMKSRGISIGEAFNQMIKDVINNLSKNEEVPNISNSLFQSNTQLKIESMNIFNVSENDLIESEGVCTFYKIKHLEFSKDITKETFLKYVHLILECENVRIPDTIPKLRLFSKIKNCENVTIY